MALLGISLSVSANSTPDISEGISLFTSGNCLLAEQFFQHQIQQCPANHRAYFFLGKIAFQQQDYRKALQMFRKAAKYDDHNSEYQHWLGKAYARVGMHAPFFKKPFLARKIKKHFIRAIELDSTNTGARQDLIVFYMLAPGILGGSKDKALEQAEILWHQNHWEGYKALGRINFLVKSYSRAEEILSRAILEYPREEQFYDDLSAVYIRQRKYLQAESLYTIAIERIPKRRAHFRIRLGELYREAGNFEKAFSVLESTIEAHPEQPAAYLAYANTALMSGEHLLSARLALERFLGLSSSRNCREKVEVLSALAQICVQLKDFPAAKEKILTLLKFSPNDKEGKHLLDVVEKQLNRSDNRMSQPDQVARVR